MDSTDATRARWVKTMNQFDHAPVLLREVVELIVAARPSLIVDGTVGGGGHAHALLGALPHARLIGLDRDPAALAAAGARLAEFGSRVRLVHAAFSETRDVLAGERAGALLVDLGVSSHQLDTAARGFSFRADAPLDMRMDPTRGETAAELVARLSEEELAQVIAELGEERFARRIARAIAQARPSTTGALAELVRRSVPKARGPERIHPATRTFQALRMLVNRELGELEDWLAAVPQALEASGVALVISFHSLEDRLVKHFFRDHSRSLKHVSRYAKKTDEDDGAELELVTRKAIFAGDDEVAHNPRARSARLRAVRRLGRPS